MKKKILFAMASSMFVAGAAQAAPSTVYNTDLINVNGAFGAGVATTVTNANGTLTTVNGPSGGANRGGAGLVFDKWVQQNVGANASVGITTTQARSGTGSVEFIGLSSQGYPDQNGNPGSGSKADMEYYFSQPLALSDFVGASYDWYRSSASTNNGIQTASFRLLVNTPNFTLSPSTALIFEPYYQGAPANVATDQWVSEAITLSSEFWNNSGLTSPGNFTNSLSSWIAANPGLVVVGLSTGFGSGWDGKFYGNVDNISYNFGARSGAFNFEVASAAVPEPATWAMLIAGFALVGASMRRRTRAIVSYA